MQLHPEPGFDTLLSATSTQFCFSASLRFLQLPSTFILANYCGSSRHLQSVPILSALCPASAFGFCLTLFPLKYCFRFSLFPADYLCFCNLHQHLKKSSQSLQHFLEFSFDTVSSFNFHPAWLLLHFYSFKFRRINFAIPGLYLTTFLIHFCKLTQTFIKLCKSRLRL